MSRSVYSLTYVTTPDFKTAKKIGRVVVKERLAACANILPTMHSIYEWKGRLNSDRECVLLLKSTQAMRKELERRVFELHPYDCPCIVHLPITGGHRDFLKWITDQTV